MKKHLKKTLSAILSLAMIAGSAVMPIAANAEGEMKSWKFDFGAAENTAEGYIAVPADKKYTAADGYGFLGLENGFAEDARSDGWTMTQGYDLQLENGAEDAVATADDDWVATTKRTEKDQDYISPIRFALKVEKNTYYKVKINLKRADASREAKVNLFTEKRHQHLLNKDIPAEGLIYEASVYVHNNWSKNTQEYVDTMLNIVAEGENVAISSVEIQQTEQGKTFWILGDSTVCEQTAAIPYFPLDHCQGVGSAMPKYIDSSWALVNEAESGLSASSSTNHFNNMINDVKEGDMVWFEFGHNDDKVTTDPATNGYLSTLQTFYTKITEKGASLIVAAPIQRDTVGQFNKDAADGEKWSASLAQYGTAASEFVEAQIAGGKTNIAYIDLNTLSLEFLNEVQTEIDNGRAADSLESLGAATTRFYYYVSKYAGYQQDYTHPNDYGADNFAKRAIDDAKERIEAAKEADATQSQTVQANIFKQIFENTRDENPVSVPAEIYKAGAPTNSYYPNQLSKVVYYDFPWLISKVTFDEDGYFAGVSGKSVACEKLSSVYGRGIVKVYTSDGTLKGTVSTVGTDRAFFDSSITGDQTIDFAKDENTVKYDADAGDKYEVYITDLTQAGDDTDTVVSNKLTEKDNIDVKEYLLQGAIGTENKEDFSSYGLAVGDEIKGKNEWTNPGGETFAYAEENGVTYAHCVTTGSATFYPEKKFTAVSSGQLYCSMDVRYKTGVFNLYFTDGSALNNWPAGRILPVQIKTDGGEVKVYLDGNAVATINSGEWITFALTIDMDYGTYSLGVNGNTYTADFAAYKSSDAILTPSNLSLIAFQNDKSSNEYDVTNIVLATLNTPELPNKTITVSTDDAAKGKVSIEGAEGSTHTAKMNTVVKAVAEPLEGCAFKDWKNKAGNVVSYSSNYELRLHEDTELTAEFETAIVDPITYLYKEDFSSLSTGTLATDGWTSANAQTLMTIEQNAEYGNYLQFAPGNQNSRGMTKDFGVNISSDYVVEMDLALTAGNNQNHTFAITNSAASNAINDSADNYIFSLDTTNSEEWTINAKDKVKIGKGKWVHLTLIVREDADAIDCIIKDSSSTLYKGTIAAVGGTSLKGIHLRSGRYNGVTLMDNIRVYTADQYVEPKEGFEVSEPVADNGNVSVTVTNYDNKSFGAQMIVASYTDEGKFVKASLSEAKTVDAAVVTGTQGTAVTFTAAAETENYKIMLWDGVGTMTPLMGAISSPISAE